MKNLTLTILMLLSLFFVSCGEDDGQNTTYNDGKQLRALITNFDNGQMNIDSFFYDNERLIKHKAFINDFFSNTFTFYYSDNRIDMFFVDNSGVESDEPLRSLFTDNEGRLIKMEYSIADGIKYVNEFEYDENGKLTKQLLDEKEGFSFVELITDEAGNVISTISDGDIAFRSENSFDNMVNPLKGMPSFTNVFDFIDPNNRTLYEGYNQNVKEWVLINNFEYDQDGYPSKRYFGVDNQVYIYID